MIEYEAELVVDSQCILGEGPVWDTRTNSVYWLDVIGKQLHQYDVSCGSHEARSLPLKISSFAFKENGGAIAAGEQGLHHLDMKRCELHPLADPEKHLPHTMFNDGKCDPKGRFYTGSTSDIDSRDGGFYRLDPSGEAIKLFDGVGCSNGIAWSNDYRIMYYIDSLAHSLDAFDFDLNTGQIQNRRTLIQFEDTNIVPDGMTWDVRGRLWIAEWGGWKVSCWDPETASCQAVVHVPAQYVTSCVFAGPQLEDLYITCARQPLSAGQLLNQPYSGGLFRVHIGERGTTCYLFKGE